MEDKFLFQNKIFKDRRKELQNNATEAEEFLWKSLRGSRMGSKFTRQYSVGPYILDFYCPKLRLAIELDGEQHKDPEAVLYDKDRDDYFKTVNITTIRFWNNDVMKDIDKVLDTISVHIKSISPPTA